MDWSLLAYALAPILGAGYARLIIKRPADRPIAHVALLSTVAIALAIGYHTWGLPQLKSWWLNTRVQTILADQPTIRLLAQQHPEIRSKLRDLLQQADSYKGNESAVQFAQRLQSQIYAPYTNEYLARASNAAIDGYARAIVDGLQHLYDRGDDSCVQLQRGDVRLASLVPPDITARVKSNLEQAIASGIQQPMEPPRTSRQLALQDVLTAHLTVKLGPGPAQAELQALNDPTLPSAEPRKYCKAILILFNGILELPPADRGDLLRVMMATQI
jgi:hypothetical protein